MTLLLVGLGNPGKEYERTRHNIGFMVVDAIKELPHDIKLLKPDTFMNNSGQVVAKEAAYLKLAPEQIVVVHDDIDLALGKVRIRLGGSSGGHNGIESIINELKTPDFWRVRVGVDRPPLNVPSDKYVLSDFSLEEREKLTKHVDQVANLVVEFLSSETKQESTINL